MKLANKKGDDILIPEGVKIILAVLCLLGLIYLAYVLFSLFTNQTAIEQAKGSLDEIIGKFDTLKEGESVEYLFLAPSGWYIRNAVIAGAVSECRDKNCLCLCDKSECSVHNVCKSARDVVFFEDASGGKIILDDLQIPKTFTLVKSREGIIMRLK